MAAKCRTNATMDYASTDPLCSTHGDRMSDTNDNVIDGQTHNAVQSGSVSGDVNVGNSQHVGSGVAIQGDVNGNLSLTITSGSDEE